MDAFLGVPSCMQNIHIRTLIRFLLRVFCIGAKIHLTLNIHGLAWVTSGQLPNFLGAPQVLEHPRREHCHSMSMTALVSIVSQHTLCV